METYPLVIEPKERELIWGGHALAERYGKPAAPHATIGESWECWDENRVRNGPYAGRTLAGLRVQIGRELTGKADPAAIFPLLTKLIDAQQALSVQVHPDDAYAQRVEHQRVGKTECWYILEAQPGATIVLGWNRDTSREEYFERTKDGLLDDLLRRVTVQPGDVFYLPAGTLHAIGAGIVLFETQQASDLTYRIFDYNRRGPDGKLRELHVEKAADVLDFGRSTAGPLRHLSYALDGLVRTALVADKNFWLERIAVPRQRAGLDTDGMPLTVTALDAPVDIEARGCEISLQPYQTAVIPAALDVVMLSAPHATAAVLAAAPLGDPEIVAKRFARAAVDVNASTAFLAQF